MARRAGTSSSNGAPPATAGVAAYARGRDTAAGSLFSYYVDEVFRLAAVYADRILRGAKPAEMPIEQPSRHELVINLKTAKALGLKIPQVVLLRADEVPMSVLRFSNIG